jgi:hypothetical protein
MFANIHSRIRFGINSVVAAARRSRLYYFGREERKLDEDSVKIWSIIKMKDRRAEGGQAMENEPMIPGVGWK